MKIDPAEIEKEYRALVALHGEPTPENRAKWAEEGACAAREFMDAVRRDELKRTRATLRRAVSRVNVLRARVRELEKAQA